MKKINKLIIFNLMFISFFIGINFVNAGGNGASINGGTTGGFSSGSYGGGDGNKYNVLNASPVTGFRMTLVNENGKTIGESKDFVANRGDKKLLVNGVLYYSKDKYNRALIVANDNENKPSFGSYKGCGYGGSCEKIVGTYFGTFSYSRSDYNYSKFIAKTPFQSIETFNTTFNTKFNFNKSINNNNVLKGDYRSVVDYFNNLNEKGYEKINEFITTWWGKENDLSKLSCEEDGELFILIEPMMTITRGAEYWFGTVTELAYFLNNQGDVGSVNYYTMSRYIYADKVKWESNEFTGKFKGLEKVKKANKPNSASTFLVDKAYGTGIVWIADAAGKCKNPSNTCKNYKALIKQYLTGKGHKYPRRKYDASKSDNSFSSLPSSSKIIKECVDGNNKWKTNNEKCKSYAETLNNDKKGCMKWAKCADYEYLGSFPGSFIDSNDSNKYVYNKLNADVKFTADNQDDDGIYNSLVYNECFIPETAMTHYECNNPDISKLTSNDNYVINPGTGMFDYKIYSSIKDEDVQSDYLNVCSCKCNSGADAINAGCIIDNVNFSNNWDEVTYQGLEAGTSPYRDKYNLQCPPCESFDNPPTDGETPGINKCTATANSTTPKTCEDYARFDNKVDLSHNMLQIKACLSTLSNGTYNSVKNFSEIYGVPTICKEDYTINYNTATFSMGINTSFGIAEYLNFNSDNNKVSAEATRTCWLDESNAADFVEDETTPTSIYWDTDGGNHTTTGGYHTTTAVNEPHYKAGLGFSQSNGDQTRTGTITVGYSNGSSQQFKVSIKYNSASNSVEYLGVDFDNTSSSHQYEPQFDDKEYSAPANADNEDNSDIKVSYRMANDKSMIYYKIEKNNNKITNWYWSTNQGDGVNYTFYPLGSPDGKAYPTLSISTDKNALKRVGRIYLKYNDGSLKEYVVKPDPTNEKEPNHFYKEIEIKPNPAANTISKSTKADGSTDLGIKAYYSYIVNQDNKVNNFLSEKSDISAYYPKAPDLGFDYYEKVRNQSFKVDSTNYLNPTVNLNENSITTTVRYNYIPKTSFAVDLVTAKFYYDKKESGIIDYKPKYSVTSDYKEYIDPIDFSDNSTGTNSNSFESKSNTNANATGNIRKLGPSDVNGHVFPIRFSTGYNQNGYGYSMWVESYNMNEKALNYKASYNQVNNNECPNQYTCNYLVSDNDCKKNLSKCETICDKTNLYCEEVCYCTDDPNDPNRPNTPRNPNDGVNFVYTSISTDTVLDKKTTTAIGENWLTEKGEKTIKEIEETSHKGETFDDDNAIYTIKLDTELVNYIKKQTNEQYVDSLNCTGTYKVDGKDIPDLYYCESSFLADLKQKYSTKIANNIKYYAYYDSSTGTYSAWK